MYKGKNGIANRMIREMKGDNTPGISQVTKPQTTVWVNGCFDVVHAGHIELLKYHYHYPPHGLDLAIQQYHRKYTLKSLSHSNVLRELL